MAKLQTLMTIGVCGSGCFACDRIAEHHADAELAGVDFQIDAALRARFPSMRFEESKIESLPFEDDAFDTVVCTHVLEHILELPAAVRELRRVCRRRLLIVVPKEREYRFTFNPHLHFFPYRHSFLKFMLPVPESAHCELIGRDIYYREIPEA